MIPKKKKKTQLRSTINNLCAEGAVMRGKLEAQREEISHFVEELSVFNKSHNKVVVK